ncbi:homeobox domain protein [Ostertagia ostertagi]
MMFDVMQDIFICGKISTVVRRNAIEFSAFHHWMKVEAKFISKKLELARQESTCLCEIRYQDVPSSSFGECRLEDKPNNPLKYKRSCALGTPGLSWHAEIRSSSSRTLAGQHVNYAITVHRKTVHRTFLRGKLDDLPRGDGPALIATDRQVKIVGKRIHRNPPRSLRKMARDSEVPSRTMRRVVPNRFGALLGVQIRRPSRMLRREVEWKNAKGSCRGPQTVILHPSPTPLYHREPDPRTILNQAELEDHRSPYLPCTINSVTRSDSEDSSSAESSAIPTERDMENMERLLKKLSEIFEADPSSQLDSSIYQTRPPSDQISQMLKALDNPVLPNNADDERDQETGRLEDLYRKRMDDLRSILHSHLHELWQGCERIMLDIHRVLKSQQMLRPIDEQDIIRAFESIRHRHEMTVTETREIVANSVMIMQTRIADATRRRRNFSKEATAILQEYYDDHFDHPYPNEEEKLQLAAKCHISMQQVSNWFGNRRIRTKKSQRSQDVTEFGRF